MKITEVKIHRIEWERGAYHWRDGIMPQGSKGSSGLLRIQTDDGVEGLSPYRGGANIEEIKYKLIGTDALDRERIWQDFWLNLRTSRLGEAIGSVDVALWDLYAKVCNQPVYRLLRAMRNKIPAYASTTTLDSIDEYLREAEGYMARGYGAIKLHAWCPRHCFHPRASSQPKPRSITRDLPAPAVRPDWVSRSTGTG